MTGTGCRERDEVDTLGVTAGLYVGRLDEPVVHLADDVRELGGHIEQRTRAQLDERTRVVRSVSAGPARPWAEPETGEQLDDPASR